MKRPSPIAAYRRSQGKMSLKAFGQLFNPPVHKGTVSRWERYGVPHARAVEIESVSGIPRYLLCPEFFGPVGGLTPAAEKFNNSH